MSVNVRHAAVFIVAASLGLSALSVPAETRLGIASLSLASGVAAFFPDGLRQAASASPKPTEFGAVGDYWSNEGWLVDVDFDEAPQPLRPRDHMSAIGPLLPPRHSPIQANGHGNQGVYLAEISDALGLLLLALMRLEIRESDGRSDYFLERSPDPELLDDIRGVENDEAVPETQRIQLAKARIGQGLFRKRVILQDGACRVTGVTEQRLLIASHIKPRRAATNGERLNGHNGRLLSRQIDALFGEHLPTFEEDGRMHVHASLSRDVLERWSIDPVRKTEPFRKEQHAFLAHHRTAFGGAT